MKHDNMRCMHCSGCAAVCPAGAITVFENFLEFNRDICISCGNCVKICPVGAWSRD